MFRNVICLLTLVLPWQLRRSLLNILLGYRIHPTSKIGVAWVLPEQLIMEAHSRIGHFTVCKGMDLLHLCQYATIGKGNWLSGYPTKKRDHFQNQIDRVPKLILGEHSAITNRHLIDCTHSVVIGKFTIIGGFRSQILTHNINLKLSIQSSAPVIIGDYCFIGTGCVILSGSILPDYSVLGAMALMNKPLIKSYTLYGGVPAKAIKSLPMDLAYLKRITGFVA